MDQMQQALQNLLQPTQLETTLFPENSRYHGVPVLTRAVRGEQVSYLARRLLPDPTRFETLEEYSVKEGDRIDNLAYQFVNDPEQFWRIADANHALDPQQLTAEVGRKLRITLPEGISGGDYA